MSELVLDRGRGAALGWAAFVACSWTWCIGMYLPVLMVRDFGLAGWFAFAIPNVIGAAALGWVLNRPGAAAAVSRQHWPVASLFSLVTILFHVFFAGWMIRRLVGDVAGPLVLAMAAAVYIVGSNDRRDSIIAAVILVASTAAFIVFGIHSSAPASAAFIRPADLASLAPVCVFGFLFCPYLDLTFLRARASTEPRTGISAFTLGFGILFVVMILFTLWYARSLAEIGYRPLSGLMAWLIGGHMTVQAGYTVAVHARAVAEDRRYRKPSTIVMVCIVAVLIYLVGCQSAAEGFYSGERVYRLFMGFYGLVFPAYVWLCMVPIGAGISQSRRIATWLISISIAGPMFWLGFIEDHMTWLLPGILVVIAAKFVLSGGAPTKVTTIKST